jgi:hypothetical protein
MPEPTPDTPVSRGFAAVRKLACQTGSENLTRLDLGQMIDDERHRAGVVAEIGRHFSALTDSGERWDRTAIDLARFVPIVEIIPVGVVIRTATDGTPAPRFYGGYA